MIVTHEDMLKSGKYLECNRCKKCIKRSKERHNGSEIICKKCYNSMGSFRQMDKSIKSARKGRSYHYTYLFNKYIREGLSVKEANQRLKAIKTVSLESHRKLEAEKPVKTFKESFEELTK